MKSRRMNLMIVGSLFCLCSIILAAPAPAQTHFSVGEAPGLARDLNSASARAVTMPVTLTINRVVAHCDPEASGQDFYAMVSIGNLSFSTADDAGDDDNSIHPNWSFTNPEVDVTLTNLQITIDMWEMDGGLPFGIDPDNPVDIHPDADKTWLLIFYNAVTGEWTVEEGEIGPGDDQPPGHLGVWSGADSDDCAEIEFDISNAFTGDTDQDGLPDNWEQFGYDYNGDGVIDIDLPALGADPLHKDIFIEVDWMMQQVGPGAHSHEPLQGIWIPLWHAFDDSPVPNPDNTTGIHLHIDTGTLYTAGIGGAFDCDGDGLSAAGDMDCDNDGIIDIGNISALSAPPLAGGGNQLPETQFLDFRGDGAVNDFYTVKAFHFLTPRNVAFHYAVFSHSLSIVKADTSGRAEIYGNDINVSLATRAGPISPISGLPVSGNVQRQAGTFMHELGHNLNLRHGGADDQKYKPNYLSVMNYSHQMGGVLGLAQNIGLDYSPNALTLMTGGLDENNLDECVPLDDERVGVTAEWTANAVADLLYAAASGTASFVDWNMDNLGNPDDGVNCGSANTEADLNFRDTGALEQIVLTGHDDWTGGDMRLDFRHSPDYDDGAPAEMVEEIDLEEELEIEAARPKFIELSHLDQFCSVRTTLTFDNFPSGTVITNQYPGVHFVDPENMEPKTRDFASRGALTVSMPNSLYAQPVPGPSSYGISLDILFDNPQYRVGVFLGNGGEGTQARLRAYDPGLNLIGAVVDTVHTPVTEFLGIHSLAGGIRGVRIDFPTSSLAEEIDNLVFDSCKKEPLPTSPPSTPFTYSARAVSASRIPQDQQNAVILLTPLDGVHLTINGAGHDTPYLGQIGRGADLSLQAPLLVWDPAGRQLLFHHWRMDDYLSFANGVRTISVSTDHNATFTAIYYQPQNTYIPLILK